MQPGIRYVNHKITELLRKNWGMQLSNPSPSEDSITQEKLRNATLALPKRIAEPLRKN